MDIDLFHFNFRIWIIMGNNTNLLRYYKIIMNFIYKIIIIAIVIYAGIEWNQVTNSYWGYLFIFIAICGNLYFLFKNSLKKSLLTDKNKKG